jgi:predicted ATPase
MVDVGQRSYAGAMLIDRVEVASALDGSAWPLSVPAIRDVAENGLTFTSDLVVLVGANGGGKSTLLEGIAEAYGSPGATPPASSCEPRRPTAWWPS